MDIVEVQERLRRAASRETTVDPDGWSESNPLWGHCVVASLVVQDILGGTLKSCHILGNGSHYWNVLPDGTEVDFTREQFYDNPRVDEITTKKQRDYVLSFPGTVFRYNKFKEAFEAAR